MIFPCTRCGLCCRNIKYIEALRAWDNGSGICKYLTENNFCQIYYKRPLICNIDESYNQLFAKIMSKQDFYQQNVEACNAMQQTVGMDSKYKVKLFDKENWNKEGLI